MCDVEVWSSVGNAALNGSQDAMMNCLRAESVKARRRRPVTDDDRDDVVLTGASRQTAAAIVIGDYFTHLFIEAATSDELTSKVDECLSHAPTRINKHHSITLTTSRIVE